MTQFEMTEKLSEKCDVTLEEARDALERGEWNVLTATHLLEQETFRRKQALSEVASACEAVAVQYAPDEAADGAGTVEREAPKVRIEAAPTAEPRKHNRSLSGAKLGDAIRRLVACGNRNRFEVRRGDETVLDVPVTVLVLGMACAFWVCVPLMVIGLFAGCRYSFTGKELGREDINAALDKGADAADRVRKAVANA